MWGLRGERLFFALVLAHVRWCATKGGCFSHDAKIRMADGAEKELRHVRPGDEVISWDEESRQVAKSVVQQVPNFQRDATDLVQVVLPNATILATEDHPFWSRSKQSLVSVRPHVTMREYGLQAEPFGDLEELEGEHSGTPHGVAAAWQRASLAALRGRRLAVNSSTTEVMTLCLHPFHWFYVHGVRVHNKGCFAPWVRVLLSNGSHVPISSVRAEDRVASWDAAEAAPAVAKVLNVEVFPAPELLELSFNAGVNASSAERQLGWRSGLVLTADHPVYSARLGAAVSMKPEATLAAYGLSVGKLQQRELLRHHLGHDVEAQVQPWGGDQPSTVMTLQLERHHWFYAEGVLVHNKGGSYGGGYSGGENLSTAGYWTANVLVVIAAVSLCCWVCKREREFAKMKEERLAMVAENGPRLTQVKWTGSYTETDPCGGRCLFCCPRIWRLKEITVRPAEYNWTFQSDGQFSGTGTHKDGLAAVVGVMVWNAETGTGQIRWEESVGKKYCVEASGSITWLSSGEAPTLSITATYMASHDCTTGVIEVQSTDFQSGQNGQVESNAGETSQTAQAAPPPSREEAQPLMS